MQLKNIKKAQTKIEELKSIDAQIAEVSSMITACEEGSGIYFRQHSDGSGAFDIDLIFEDGDYPREMYTNIAKSVYNEFNLHRDKIIAEIETF